MGITEREREIETCAHAREPKWSLHIFRTIKWFVRDFYVFVQVHMWMCARAISTAFFAWRFHYKFERERASESNDLNVVFVCK